jgi:hypothetical protein
MRRKKRRKISHDQPSKQNRIETNAKTQWMMATDTKTELFDIRLGFGFDTNIKQNHKQIWKNYFLVPEAAIVAEPPPCAIDPCFTSSENDDDNNDDDDDDDDDECGAFGWYCCCCCCCCCE